MANIFVSAHGGRWSNQVENVRVPENSKVAYYVEDGEILSNDIGYRIFDELKAGNEHNINIVKEKDAGSNTYDYACWYANEFADHCGIYKVGTGELLKDLQNYTEDNPLSLSDIIQEFPDCTIYWVCCREVSQV